jgi:hypothetical protein
MNPAGNNAFHSGYLYVKASSSNPTPRRIATLQEVSFAFKGSNKELMGEMQFAEAVGRSDIKITGKAKTGKFVADAFNDIFFNQSATTGHKKVAYDEAGVVTVGHTYTVDNDDDFVEDLGVALVSTGAQMKRVASSPAAGEYSVNESTGVYTFNTANDGAAIIVSYVYSDDTAGKTIPIINTLAGEAPTFQSIFFNKFQGETVYLKLNAVVAENLDFGFKTGDFAMPDFSFSAQADTAGNVGEYSQSRA